jgi:hypothetical protein
VGIVLFIILRAVVQFSDPQSSQNYQSPPHAPNVRQTEEMLRKLRGSIGSAGRDPSSPLPAPWPPGSLGPRTTGGRWSVDGGQNVQWPPDPSGPGTTPLLDGSQSPSPLPGGTPPKPDPLEKARGAIREAILRQSTSAPARPPLPSPADPAASPPVTPRGSPP